MAKFNLTRWLRSLVGEKPTTIRRPKARTRLEMEVLEARLAPADTRIWDGGGTDNNWRTAANWVNDVAPVAGDDLVFQSLTGNPSVTANNNFANGTLFNSITFSGNNYTLTGNTVTLGSAAAGSGFIIANLGSTNNTIQLPLELGGAAGNHQFFTVGTAGATLRITGEISGSTGVQLDKDGPGTLILEHDNSDFTGTIAIVEGILNIRDANALGDTNGRTTVLSTVNRSGQLQIENALGMTIAEPLNLNGSGPNAQGALVNMVGNNIWVGPIVLDSDTTIGAIDDLGTLASTGTAPTFNAGLVEGLTIHGQITDTATGHNLTKEGNGRIILDPLGVAEGNTYRGNTIVNDGILTIRHSLALGNAPAPLFDSSPIPRPINGTIVNSFPNRSGTLQVEYTEADVPAGQPARIDPNVTSSVSGGPVDGFNIPSEFLVLNGPGLDGVHRLPKRSLGAGVTPGVFKSYGPGETVLGALNNYAGTNTWVQNISLWSDNSTMIGDNLFWNFGGPVLPVVGIGAEANSNLIITGHIDDRYITGSAVVSTNQYSLAKTRQGRVVIVHDNNYRGKTEILEGYLTIRDSKALGTGNNTTNTATFVFPGGTLELEADLIPDSQSGRLPTDDPSLPPTSSLYATPPGGLPHLSTDIIIGSLLPNEGELLRPMGNGVAGDGAVRSVRGVNELIGPFQMQRQLPRGGVTFTDAGASIGVLPDYDMTGLTNTPADVFEAMFRRSQLTLSGDVGDDPGVGRSDLTKFGLGELVLTGPTVGGVLQGNSYTGRTFITEGWITARNDHALGADLTTRPDTLQRETFINEGAALVLKRTREATPQNINLSERIFVSGLGLSVAGRNASEPLLYFTTATSELYHDGPVPNTGGAILNLSGDNTITGIVTLVGTATAPQVGIGVDLDSTDATSDIAGVTTSSLTFTNLVRDDVSNITSHPLTGSTAYPFGITPPAANPTGFRKVGRKRMTLQGPGTYSGDNTVAAGVVRIQNDTALGSGVIAVPVNAGSLTPGQTTVEDDAALEISGYVATQNGGAGGGIQLFEILNFVGDGNRTADDPTHNYSSPVRVETLTNRDSDSLIRAPISIANGTGNGVGDPDLIGIDTQPDSRLSLFETISGTGGFTKDGTGKLVLGGNNTYQGDTVISGGIVNVQNSSALGSPSVAEVQTVLLGGATSGTFTLIVGADTAGPFPFAESATNIQTALNNLPGVIAFGGSFSVSRTVNLLTITFLGRYFGFDQVLLNAEGQGGTTVNSLVAAPASLVQNGGGSTILADGAQIELQGDISVGGESLRVEGNGPTVAPAIPQRWFAMGPSPILASPDGGGTALASQNMTGRVDSVTTDPFDPNVIYLAAASGGAWRSRNGGLTWEPLIDNINGDPVDANKVLFAGAIAISPNNSNVIYVALGDANNAFDSYYGRGILKSTDYGRTWTLYQGPSGAFDRRTVSKMIVDPRFDDVVYLAVQGNDATGGGTLGMGGVNGAAAGNNGIWRGLTRISDGANGVWDNLTQAANAAADSATSIFATTNLHYTDLVVVDASGQPTPNNRVVAFAIGNADAIVSYNGVYVSTNVDALANPLAPTPVFNLGGFDITTDSNRNRWGVIKVAGAKNPNNNNVVTFISAGAYPFLPGVPPPYGALHGTLRYVNRGSVTYDPNTGTWSAPTWENNTGQPIAQPTAAQAAGVYGINNNVNIFPQVWYNSTLALNLAAGTLFVGGMGQPFNTPNGTGPLLLVASNLTAGSGTLGAWSDIGANTPAPHAQYHTASYDNQGRLLVGTDGGIWRFEPVTGGGTWSNLNGNFLQTNQFLGLDVHPFDPFRAIGGSWSNGTEVYSDSPYWLSTDGGSSGTVLINNENPNIVYHVKINDPVATGAAASIQLRRSTDGGMSWATLTLPNSPTAPNTTTTFPYTNRAGAYPTTTGINFPVTLDRADPSRLLYAAGSTIYESNNADASTPTFNSIGTAALDGLGRIIQIALADRQGKWASDSDFPLAIDNGADSYDPNTIYLLTDNGVWVTKNRGQVWDQRNTGLPGMPGAAEDYSDIVVDPSNRDVAYVVRHVFGVTGNTGHVYQTVNGGRTWTDVSGSLPNLPTWKVVVNSRSFDATLGYNREIFIGNDHGVYVGDVAGASWERLGVGLPNVQVKTLVFNALTNMLSAGTYGRGLYQVWLDESRATGVGFNSGAVRSITGSSAWTGIVDLTDSAFLRTEVNTQLNFVGTIYGDSGSQINKVGTGRVVFSGANQYEGVTDILEGALVTRNKAALGDTAANTIVEIGAALHMQTDLENEPVTLNGNGILFNGHFTGALRAVTGDGFNNLDITFTGPLTLNDMAQGPTNNSPLPSDTAPQITIGVDSGAQLTIGPKAGLIGTGVISDPAGARNLTKELSGTLILSGANTYRGFTQVNQGVLRATNSSSLGAGTNVAADGTRVRNGAVLQLTNNVTIADERLDLSGTGINSTGALRSLSGDNNWTGNVVLQYITSLPAPPPVQPPVNLVSVGVDAGSLNISGVVSETGGSFGLDKVGAGRLILSGTSDNTYSGVTTVQAGVLNIRKDGALGATTAGTVVVSGAALELEGPASPGGIAYDPETVTLKGTGIGNTGALLNVQGDNTWTGGVILNSTISTGSSNPRTNINIGANSGTQLLVSGVVADPAMPPNVKPANLHKVGDGTLAFSNANTYTGRTLVDDGILNIRNNDALGTHAVGTYDPSTVNDNATFVAAGATLQLQNNITIDAEILRLSGAGHDSGAGGRGALDNASGTNFWDSTIHLADANVAIGSTAGTLVIRGVITEDGPNSPARGVSKVGAGTLEYRDPTAGTSDNAYAGLTWVKDGTLALRRTVDTRNFDGDLRIGDDVGADNSAVVRLLLNEQIRDLALIEILRDGRLDLNDLNEVTTQLFIREGNVTTGSGDLTTTTLDMIGGNINLNNAAGTLILAGSPAMTATASDSGETASITGAGTVDLNSATRTFVVNDNPNTSVSDLQIVSSIAGTGGLIKDGSGRMEIDNASNPYTGVTTIREGVLQVDGTIGDVFLDDDGATGKGTLSGAEHLDQTSPNVTSITATSNGGQVDPGDTPGAPVPPRDILRVAGDVQWNSATTFFVDLNRLFAAGPLEAGRDYDQLAVTGAINLNDAKIAGRLDAVGAGIFTADPSSGTPGDTFIIITADGGVTGIFTDNSGNPINDGGAAFIGGGKFIVDYQANAVVLTKVKAQTTIHVEASSGAANTVWGELVTFDVSFTPEPGAGNPPDTSTIEVRLDLNNDSIVDYVTSVTYAELHNNMGDTLNLLDLFGVVLDVGTHSVEVRFRDPTGNYADYDDGAPAGSFDSTTHTVTRANVAIQLSASTNNNPSKSVFGQPVTFTAVLSVVGPGGQVPGTDVIVSPTDPGSVRFILDSGTPVDVPVFFNGTAFIAEFTPSPTMNVGPHSLTAQFVDDAGVDFFNDHFQMLVPAGPFAHQVDKAQVDITVTASPNPANPPPGQDVVITVDVTARLPGAGIPNGGQIVIKSNGGNFTTGTLVNGQFVFDSPTGTSFTFGTYILSATYGGDANFEPNLVGGSTTLIVSSATTTALTSSLNPSTYGQNVTFTATITANSSPTARPTGTVDFVDTLDGIYDLSDPVLPGGDDVLVNTGSFPSRATVTLNSLERGDHLIIAVFTSNNSLYADSMAGLPSTPAPNPVQRVNPATPTVTLGSTTPGSTVFGIPIDFTVTVGPVGALQPIGTVDIIDSVDGVIGGADVVLADDVVYTGGTLTVQLANVPVGNPRRLYARFTAANNSLGLPNYSPANSALHSRTVTRASTQTVLAPAGTTSAEYGAVDVTATVTPTTGGGVPNGNVTFVVTPSVGTPFNRVVPLDGAGVATYDHIPATPAIDPLPPGTYSIVARYNLDNSSSNYSASNSDTINHTVTKADTQTEVTSTNYNAIFGEADIAAAVTRVNPGTGTPTGSVRFEAKNTTTLVVTTFTDSDASDGFHLPSTFLNVGTYEVTAFYLGDLVNNFWNTSSDVLDPNQVVNPATVSIDVDATPGSSVFGQQVTLGITVAPTAGTAVPTGTVDIVSSADNIIGNGDDVLIGDDRPLVNGAVSFPTQDLPAGTRQIGVIYTSNSTNFTSDDNESTMPSYTVAQGDVLGTLVSDDLEVLYGAQVTFTATFAAKPPAVARAQDDYRPEGSATLFIDNIAVDTQPLTGVGATGVAEFVVDTSLLTLGSRNVFVRYNGDGTPDNFAGGDTNTLAQVIKDNTDTDFTATSPSFYGLGVMFEVTIHPEAASSPTPTGTVTFIIDQGLPSQRTFAGRSVVGGVAQTPSITDLTVGTHTVRATYSGDGSYFGSDSVDSGPLFNITHTVNRASTEVIVGQNAVTTVYGEPFTFTAQVQIDNGEGAGVPDGQVQFVLDGANHAPITVTRPLTPAGTFATASLTRANLSANLPADTYVVTVNYLGATTSQKFASSTGTLAPDHVVDPADVTVVVASSRPVSRFSQSVTFTATVTAQAPGAPGAGSPTGRVTFVIDEGTAGEQVIVDSTVDSTGTNLARWSYTTTTLPVGTHTVRAIYEDSVGGNFATESDTLDVNQVVNPSPVQILRAPANVRSSVAIGAGNPIRVEVRTLAGIRDTAFNGLVSLQKVSGPGGVVGTLTVNAIQGLATFTNVAFGPALGTYTIRAVAKGFASPTSAPIVCWPSKFAAAVPTNIVANQSITVRVNTFSAVNALASTYNGTYVLKQLTGPTGSLTNGVTRYTTTGAFSNGTTTFNLQMTMNGTYTFRITETNPPAGLAPLSLVITVTVGPIRRRS